MQIKHSTRAPLMPANINLNSSIRADERKDFDEFNKQRVACLEEGKRRAKMYKLVIPECCIGLGFHLSSIIIIFRPRKRRSSKSCDEPPLSREVSSSSRLPPVSTSLFLSYHSPASKSSPYHLPQSSPLRCEALLAKLEFELSS